MRTRITVTFDDGSGWVFTSSGEEDQYEQETDWVNEGFSRRGEIVTANPLAKKKVLRYIESVTTGSNGILGATIRTERID